MSLSYSRLSTYQMCPRKYKYIYVEKIQRTQLDERNIDTEFGSAIHEGLHTMWKHKDVDMAKDSFTRAYPTLDGQPDINKNHESGLFLLERYFVAYNDQIKNCDILEQEVLNEMDVDGITGRVKLDLIFRNEDGVFFRDFKSKSYVPRINYYKYHTQMDFYFYYCMTKYGECMGGIIDNLIIKAEPDENAGNKFKAKKYNPKLHPDDPMQFDYSHRQPMWKYKNRWKDAEDVEGDIQAHKIRCYGYHAQFSSDSIMVSLETLDDFKTDLKDWHGRIEADKTYVKNKCSCFAFNRQCDYMELCENFDDEAIKETAYEPKEEQVTHKA